MKLNEERVLIDGPAGAIELIVENPGAPRGIALICHPHPLFGGANTNKVTQTLARTFTHLDYVALRPNFRGVGGSGGTHDNGNGECEDMLTILAEAKRRYGDLPVALALRTAPTLLTPHPAEAARLLDTSVSAVQADRIAAALALAEAGAKVIVASSTQDQTGQPGPSGMPSRNQSMKKTVQTTLRMIA